MAEMSAQAPGHLALESSDRRGSDMAIDKPLQDSNDGNAQSGDDVVKSDSPRRENSLKQKTILRQGYLKVKQDGQVVYKKTASQAIMAATQLGIGYSVGRLSAKPERDVLMVDFYFVEKVWFPAQGSKETPSHKYDDFRFKTYAPVAFRFFRDLFNILPSDFLISLANEPIREISNPGASGSLFFVSNDDLFIVKTVQKKEATFLQQLLPGYYMNLHQNPRTLLPKFFGLYCFQSGSSNIRLTVMNNLLPSQFKCHLKFDLKGSTYKRKANKAERSKKSPTYKDLDYIEMFPEGILLDAAIYDVLIKTISRDVRVLESFQIMDYSFLLGIHNLDEAELEQEQAGHPVKEGNPVVTPERAARRNEFGAALEAIQVNDGEEVRPIGGVNAKTVDGQRLILFIGIIDILQSYRFMKKAEHTWKSMFVADADTVSVHKPSFYAKRFLDFIKNSVFKRVAPVQRGPSKRKTVRTGHATPAFSNVPTTIQAAQGVVNLMVTAPALPAVSDATPPKSSLGVAVENSNAFSKKVLFSVPDQVESELKGKENIAMLDLATGSSETAVTTNEIVLQIRDDEVLSPYTSLQSNEKVKSEAIALGEGDLPLATATNGEVMLPLGQIGVKYAVNVSPRP